MATAILDFATDSVDHVESREDVGLREKLEQLGLDYEVARVSISSVDTDRNEYQTRQHSIVDVETVDRYEMALKSGTSVFPEMLFAATTVGGRHRIVAHKKAGFSSTTGLVVYVKSDTDKAKLVTISRWDNFRNGAPESINAHYQGLAQECIATAGGVLSGLPPRHVIDEIAARNGLGGGYKTRLKLHIRSMLFQAECRSMRITKIPDNTALCAAAYEFVDRAGFEEIAKAICANQAHKGITGIVKECHQRKLSGQQAVAFIRDSSSGFSEAPSGPTAADVARLRCKAFSDAVGKLEQDPSVTKHAIELLEKHIEDAFERAAQITSHIKERIDHE
jgi:hypothetical protein